MRVRLTFFALDSLSAAFLLLEWVLTAGSSSARRELRPRLVSIAPDFLAATFFRLGARFEDLTFRVAMCVGRASRADRFRLGARQVLAAIVAPHVHGEYRPVQWHRTPHAMPRRPDVENEDAG